LPYHRRGYAASVLPPEEVAGPPTASALAAYPGARVETSRADEPPTELAGEELSCRAA